MKKTHRAEDIELNQWIGQRLTQVRLSVKPALSQNELTRRLGVTRQTVMNWASGKQCINTVDLFACVRILGCDISQLFPLINEKGEYIAPEDYTGETPHLKVLSWDEIEKEASDKESIRLQKLDEKLESKKKKEELV